MKLLTTETSFIKTIDLAKNLTGEYDQQVIFHCYWSGNLNEKHLYSILSCYYFNVHKNKHKIILWLENSVPNEYTGEIQKYCEMRPFELANEIKNTEFMPAEFYYKQELSYYSDVVRYLLLYNYGGCWFDLDCLILKCFDPIFANFGTEICVYQWENQNYPNGAIYISLEPKSIRMRNNMEYILNLNKGWGFQEALLTYDLLLDMLVLPCSWFDPDWIKNPFGIGTVNFFKNIHRQYNFNNFFNGAFCYHLHNKWNLGIEENSPFKQLVKIIYADLQKNKN